MTGKDIGNGTTARWLEWVEKEIPVRSFHILAHFLFLAAIAMAGIFYLERNIGDPGWRIFYIINEENLCPSHGRWILAFVQLLPLAAVKAGLSLKSVLILHAIGPALFFYSLYLYTGFRLKNLWASMAIVMLLVFSIGEIYFHWADLEKQLMTAMLVTLYATLFRKEKRLPESWLLIPLFIFMILSSHPMAIIAFVFLIVWYTIHKKKPDLFVLAISAVFLYLNTLIADTYEASMISELGDIITNLHIHELSIGPRLLSLLTHNLVVWMLAIATLAILFLKRKFLLFAMFTCVITGVLAIIMLLVPSAQDEPYLTPLVVLVLLLFLSEANKSFFPKRSGLILTALIFLMGTISILQNSTWAIDKINLQKEMIHMTEGLEGSRFLFHDENIPGVRDELLTGYYFAETMMISALDGPEKASVAIPASMVIFHLNSIREILPDSVIQEYFPAATEQEVMEQLPFYADTYFREDYLEGQFQLYFHENLNSRYFRNTSDPFRWLPLN